MGVAGPVSVDGGSSPAKVPPLATTGGALLASVNRGLLGHQQRRRLTRPRPQVRDDPRAGVPRRRRCRGPGARLVDPRQLRGAEGRPRRTTNHGELLDVTPYVVGNSVYLRFRYDTKDAMGMNMATIATEAVCGVVEAETAASLVALSGNLCSDKSPPPSAPSRGAAGTSPPTFESRARVVEERLHTTPKRSRNSHTQEPGRLREGREPRVQRPRRQRRRRDVPRHRAGRGAGRRGANAITTAEVQDGDLYVSVSIASLEVGTVGGGETPTQSEGPRYPRRQRRRRPAGSNADALARCIAVGSLAGELSFSPRSPRGTSPAPTPNSVGNCMGVVVRPRFIGSEFVDPTLIMNVLSRDTTRLRDTRYNAYAYHEHITKG